MTGIGTLAGGELFGERLAVPYDTKDSEEEHSCFSDNTTVDHQRRRRERPTDLPRPRRRGQQDRAVGHRPRRRASIRRSTQRIRDALDAGRRRDGGDPRAVRPGDPRHRRCARAASRSRRRSTPLDADHQDSLVAAADCSGSRSAPRCRDRSAPCAARCDCRAGLRCSCSCVAACSGDERRRGVDASGEPCRRPSPSPAGPRPCSTPRRSRSRAARRPSTATRERRSPSATRSSTTTGSSPRAAPTGATASGPVFNALSCSGCHFHDGRAAAAGRPVSAHASGLLFRLSVPGRTRTASRCPNRPTAGSSTTSAIPGVPAEGTFSDRPTARSRASSTTARRTRWTSRRYRIDGELRAAGERRDDLAADRPGDRRRWVCSRRCRRATILANADPDDADGDGISGRPNSVWDVAGAGDGARPVRMEGRASRPCEQQVAGAFQGDIGITSSLSPEQPCTAAQTACVRGGRPAASRSSTTTSSIASTFYSRTLAVPARRDVDEPDGDRRGPDVRRPRLLELPRADADDRRRPTSLRSPSR